MSEFGDFFTELGDSITGKSKRELAQRQLDQQLKIAEDQLALEEGEDKLKYNPEYAKVKNVRYVIFGLLALVLVFILVKYVF